MIDYSRNLMISLLQPAFCSVKIKNTPINWLYYRGSWDGLVSW